MKKTLIAIFIILILLAAGLYLYLFFTKKSPSDIPVISNFFPKSENVVIKEISVSDRIIKLQLEVNNLKNEAAGARESGDEKTASEKEQKAADLENEIKNLKENGFTIINSEEKIGSEKNSENILNEPVVSAAVFGSSTLRYIKKLNGHIFDSDFENKNTTEKSNTTILGIFNALWGKEGTALILNFLDNSGNPKFFSADVNDTDIAGIFLPESVKSAAISPLTNKIAYIEDIKGRGVVFVADTKNENKKQIASLPLSDLKILWKGKNDLSIFSSPSAFSNGFLYSINTETKEIQKIAEGNGLTAIWNDAGNKAFVSLSTNNEIENKIIISDKTGVLEYPISLKTLPEKCVFSKTQESVIYCAVPQNFPRGIYPDNWYMGKAEFNDIIYKINFKTGENNIINDEIASNYLDAINLILGPNENYLFFINKKDNFLWKVKI